MAKPAQSALSEQRVHGGEADTGKNLGVGHFVVPADAKDATETLHVVTVQLLLLLPGFTPVQEGADYADFVHCHLGLSGQLGFLPDVSGSQKPIQFRTSAIAGVARARLHATTCCLWDSSSRFFLKVYS